MLADWNDKWVINNFHWNHTLWFPFNKCWYAIYNILYLNRFERSHPIEITSLFLLLAPWRTCDEFACVPWKDEDSTLLAGETNLRYNGTSHYWEGNTTGAPVRCGSRPPQCFIHSRVLQQVSKVHWRKLRILSFLSWAINALISEYTRL